MIINREYVLSIKVGAVPDWIEAMRGSSVYDFSSAIASLEHSSREIGMVIEIKIESRSCLPQTASECDLLTCVNCGRFLVSGEVAPWCNDCRRLEEACARHYCEDCGAHLAGYDPEVTVCEICQEVRAKTAQEVLDTLTESLSGVPVTRAVPNGCCDCLDPSANCICDPCLEQRR